MPLPLFHIKKLLTSLLLACGLALWAWAWLSDLSGAPAPVAAAPAARLKLAASPVTVTLISSKDNTLIEDSEGDLSNGSGENFFAGRTGQGSNSIRRGVIAFDLSAIPAGSTIISVTLDLHVTDVPSPLITQPFTLHTLSADWGEGSSSSGGIGAPATTGDATWLHRFFNTTFWITAGGDFNPTASANTQIGGVGDYSWSSAQMVIDLQGWLDNPATNFGWLVKGDESVSKTARGFSSRENSAPADRPALIVTYLPPPPSLTLVKQVSNANPIPGQVISYTIVVTNSGQSPATGARISDTLPSGINFVGPVTLNPSGAGTPGSSGTLPTLASNLTITPGTKVILTFQASVNASVLPGTVLTNTAAITSNEINSPISNGIKLEVAWSLYLPIIRKT